MRILKVIGIILLALLGIILILGIIAPKEVATEQSIVIDAPQEMVFNMVNDLSTWESWSPWKEMDPGMVVTFGDKVEGEGAYYTWTGKEAGSGKMTITSSSQPDSLHTMVEFDGMGSAQGSWHFKNVEGGTKASWGFDSRMPFPMNAMLLFVDMEEAVGKDFSRGLSLLKEQVEEKAAMSMKNKTFEVKTVEMPTRYYIGIRQAISMDKITEFYANSYGKLMKALQENNVEMDGMPCGLTYTWDEANQQTDLAAAIPIKTNAQIKGFITIEVPAGKALAVDYYGDYHGIGTAHEAIDAYAVENGIETGLPAIEEYVTDPGQEPDTTKWLTKVLYPFEPEM